MNDRFWRAGRDDATLGNKMLDADYFLDPAEYASYTMGYQHWMERGNGLVH